MLIRRYLQLIYKNQVVFSFRKRLNMSFTNDKSRKILQDNEILYKKLMIIAYRPSLHSYKETIPFTPSSYINRTKKQQQMYFDNQVMSILNQLKIKLMHM